MWSILHKWISKFFVFEEGFHRTEFWVALFEGTSLRLHSLGYPLTPRCCWRRAILLSWPVCSCSSENTIFLWSVWTRTISSDTLQQIVPQYTVWKACMWIYATWWWGDGQNKHTTWCKLFTVLPSPFSLCFRGMNFFSWAHVCSARDS